MSASPQASHIAIPIHRSRSIRQGHIDHDSPSQQLAPIPSHRTRIDKHSVLTAPEPRPPAHLHEQRSREQAQQGKGGLQHAVGVPLVLLRVRVRVHVFVQPLRLPVIEAT